jgi:hypothetical protein
MSRWPLPPRSSSAGTGRPATHIFNPSGVHLTIFSGLIVTGARHHVGQDIAITQFYPPHMCCSSSWSRCRAVLFGVTTMTMAAVGRVSVWCELLRADRDVLLRFVHSDCGPSACTCFSRIVHCAADRAQAADLRRSGLSTVARMILMLNGIPPF